MTDVIERSPIFRNGPGPLASRGTTAWKRSLLDLYEILSLMAEHGREVTTSDLNRIRPSKADSYATTYDAMRSPEGSVLVSVDEPPAKEPSKARRAERIFAQIKYVANQVGFDVERVLNEDHPPRWVLRIQDPPRAWAIVNRELNKFDPSRVYQKEWRRRKTEERKSEGLCVSCGKAPAERGNRCMKCIEAWDKAEVERQLSRRLAGLCQDCGLAPVVSGTLYCKGCSEKNKVLGARFYAKRVELGVCPRCGGDLDRKGFKTCSKCSEVTLERHKLLQEKGLCRSCGKEPPVTGRRLCEGCAAATRATVYRRRDDLISRGICPDCGTRKAKPGAQTCVECSNARAARRAAARKKAI